MKVRSLAIVFSMVIAFGVLGIALTAAQDPAPPDQTESEETLREQEAALAAEAAANAAAATKPAVPGDYSPGVLDPDATLFVGVGDTTFDTYLIDPATDDAFPLFDGFEIWGAALDAANRRILFVEGSELGEWPVDGVPQILGPLTSSATGGPINFVGLAYGNGTVYAVRNITTAAGPEGIYTIDPNTLEATLYTTYKPLASTIDVGGLAVDPATGKLYGTNDGPFNRGLVEIDAEGDVLLISPYPAGVTHNDFDGLTFGDGRFYLTTDDENEFQVFDPASMSYTDVISSPWTGDQIFAGAGWIENDPAVSLAKTAGLDPNACAATDELELTAPADVTYCFRVTNTGGVTLTRHTVNDSELGNLLNNFAFPLAPGASAFITETAHIEHTTVNTATWTAFNPGPVDTAMGSDAATVTVLEPEVSLAKTVGLDPNVCATATELVIPAPDEVTYCFRITNTGPISLTLHDLSDSRLGGILDNFAYNLIPGASAFLTETATIERTTANVAHWTAFNPGPVNIDADSARALVILEGPRYLYLPVLRRP